MRRKFHNVTEAELAKAFDAYLRPAIIKMCDEAFGGMSTSVGDCVPHDYNLIGALYTALHAQWLKAQRDPLPRNNPENG